MVVSMRKEKITQRKVKLHDRNKNRDKYDLKVLKKVLPRLNKYIILNKLGEESVNFSDSLAVRALNKAILLHYYGIYFWEFPKQNLCPPIPGRADYIHHIADLLIQSNQGQLPSADKITCLDIGVGASCIFPIIGITEYGWSFIASDIDPKSISSAQLIVQSNDSLKGLVDFRLQKNRGAIFKGVLKPNEKIDLVLCNPPFHSSEDQARMSTQRKVKNLSGKKQDLLTFNFSGNSNELAFKGGEYTFIKNIILGSKKISKDCYWFTVLISKKSNLSGIYTLLKKNEAIQVQTIPLETGNKSSRIIAWSFLTLEQASLWKIKYWG